MLGERDFCQDSHTLAGFCAGSGVLFSLTWLRPLANSHPALQATRTFYQQKRLHSLRIPDSGLKVGPCSHLPHQHGDTPLLWSYSGGCHKLGSQELERKTTL